LCADQTVLSHRACGGAATDRPQKTSILERFSGLAVVTRRAATGT
jgi:hypothetical protein